MIFIKRSKPLRDVKGFTILRLDNEFRHTLQLEYVGQPHAAA